MNAVSVSFSLFIYIIIAVAALSAIAIVISIIAYRLRLKRAVENEKKADYTAAEYQQKSQAHSKLPTPSATSNIVYKVIVIILLIYICISNSLITHIMNKQDDLKDYTAQECMEIRNSIENMRNYIKEENSMVTDLHVEVSEMDLVENTCELEFIASFKEILADAAVSLILSDNTVVTLERESAGIYHGFTQTAIFNNTLSDDIRISVSDGTTDRLEDITSDISFCDLYSYTLPVICPSVGFNYHDKVTSVNVNLLNGIKEENLKHVFENVKSSELVCNFSGEELAREDILQKIQNGQYDDINTEIYSFDRVESTDKLDIVINTILNDGYTIKCNMSIPLTDVDPVTTCSEIYSPDGTLLYTINE